MKLIQFGGGRKLFCESVDQAKAMIEGIAVVAEGNGHVMYLHRRDKCCKCGAIIVRIADVIYIMPRMVAPCTRSIS